MNPRTLYSKFPYREVHEILRQDKCEIDYDFAGFTAQYEALAKIIPLDCTVIDFGCYLAPQCYFFRNHARYIGIDVIGMKRFRMSNTTHVVMDIRSWLTRYADKYTYKTFAICNFVPAFEEVELVKRHFKNIFVYYPEPERLAVPDAD